MNMPNKLTLIRILLIPIFIVFYQIDTEWAEFAALIIFIAATATDKLDGYLARKNNEITTFGKLMDPLADKILIMSALICFLENNSKFITSIVVIVILTRELIVTGLRLIALGERRVIAASPWGKAKTVSQFVLIIGIMVFDIARNYLEQFDKVYDVLTLIFVIIAVLLTIISGVDYIIRNRKVITLK